MAATENQMQVTDPESGMPEDGPAGHPSANQSTVDIDLADLFGGLVTPNSTTGEITDKPSGFSLSDSGGAFDIGAPQWELLHGGADGPDYLERRRREEAEAADALNGTPGASPILPTPPVSPLSNAHQTSAEDRAKARLAAAKKKRHRSTILTSSLGLTAAPALITGPSLLGMQWEPGGYQGPALMKPLSEIPDYGKKLLGE